MQEDKRVQTIRVHKKGCDSWPDEYLRCDLKAGVKARISWVLLEAVWLGMFWQWNAELID